MKNLIDISKEEYSLLNRYIGQGKINASLIFFGNEPGTSEGDIIHTIKSLQEDEHTDLGSGFLLNEGYSKPTRSEFVNFMSKLYLACKDKDINWLYDLSPEYNKKLINHNNLPLSEKDMCLLNLRPIPRATEDTWEYSGIDVKGYHRLWNFHLKGHYSDPEQQLRLKTFEVVFKKRTGLVIGIGDKANKRKFFEKIYPDIQFIKSDLPTHTIYFDTKYKIVLSDYFNSRNGIKMSGLRELYEFLESRHLV